MSTPEKNPSQILFLPGAIGRTHLWEPVKGSLSGKAHKAHIGWPGFTDTPASPLVNGIDDLVKMVLAKVDQPTALIAQSMGGVIAIQAALAKPKLITHLVLTATSGGIDVSALGGEDWRPALIESNPQLPRWFSTYQEDLSAKLPTIQIPTLLIWGDADPISPVRVGEHLASLLPHAHLHVVKGGDHNLAETHAAEVAPLISKFLATA
jgi:pimeloyl-ACP methyl ester carboxylesterase